MHMGHNQFKAYVVEEQGNHFAGSIKTRSVSELPDHGLFIKVRFSSLNYKDALSANGNRGVTKHYPHTPGIDAVGTVVSSDTGKFRVNDEVIVTSYDLGMNTPGGFGQYIKVPSEWAVTLPEAMTSKESMIMGTAGLTAGMSVMKLTESVKPDDGPVVVSGATGGVGALSVAILAKLGYKVSAITGKEQEEDFLVKIGAAEVILRQDFQTEDARPMLKGRFAGAVDTVGGAILENIIKSTQHAGMVTCCGNVASPELNMTVYPFILRGVSLVGIDSQNAPISHRVKVWNQLAKDWKPDSLLDIYKEISLTELSDHMKLMLEGKLKGRIILNLEA